MICRKIRGFSAVARARVPGHARCSTGRRMSDRRRANRFVIPEAARGVFRMMQDVYVEQADPEGVSLVADAPLPAGEQLLLELPGGTGSRALVHVEVVESLPVRVGDMVKYRTRLRVLDPGGDGIGRRPGAGALS